MSRKSKYQREKNPMSMVIYIIAAVVLIACLVFLVFCSRRRQEEYRETVKTVSQSETEYEMKKNAPETETETEAQTESETETEPETETETENKSMSILILNGTKRQGVAAYWKSELEKNGYTDVSAASYNGAIEDKTVIYADDVKAAQQMRAVFTDAVIKKGTVSEDIETEAGNPVPGKTDLCIVIGRNDAKSE